MQDANSGEVLTLAWMNEEAFNKTLETGLVTFWSRSRKQLWTKGETSGNTMRLAELKLDCDGDALVARVVAEGPACHTGESDCFFQTVFKNKQVLSESPKQNWGDSFGALLSAVRRLLQERKATLPEGSYSTYLFEKGLDKILKKIGEEATETVIAALGSDREELKDELCDLLFHMLVLMVEKGISLEDLRRVMSKRHSSDDTEGTSELKVARPNGCLELETKLLAASAPDIHREIYRALEVMYRAHAGQTRAEGTPYATHPLEVALITVIECGLQSKDAIVTSLLHDVLEDDLSTTPDQLKESFGEVVHDATVALTKMYKRDGTPKQEGLKRYFDGLKNSSDLARTIKICDRVHNLRTIGKTGRSDDVIAAYLSESHEQLLPLSDCDGSKGLKKAGELLKQLLKT
jgi:phosphoribosyl-ATP pyrophosphohydrolase/phosphoribosyl-AMP cyclohydrolase